MNPDIKNATHAELIRILVMDTAPDSRIQPREVWSPDEHESYRGMDTIELFAYGDYAGNDLDVANHREFVKVFGDVFYTETERATDYVAVYLCNDRRMPLFDLSRLDDQARADFDELETLRSIVEVMIGLQDYPLMSDETHSEYVDELADAAWAQYMCSDISRAVEEYMAARGSEGENGQQDWDWHDLMESTQEEFREAFYAYPDHEWTCESATSVVCRTEQAGIVHACYVVWEVGHCPCERCEDKRGETLPLNA